MFCDIFKMSSVLPKHSKPKPQGGINAKKPQPAPTTKLGPAKKNNGSQQRLTDETNQKAKADKADQSFNTMTSTSLSLMQKVTLSMSAQRSQTKHSGQPMNDQAKHLQESSGKKTISTSTLQLTPDTTLKKAAYPSLTQRTASQSCISEKNRSAKAVKRDRSFDPSKPLDLDKATEIKRSQTIYQEGQPLAMNVKALEGPPAEQLPCFKRVSKKGRADSKLDGDTTNEEEFIQQNQQVEINSMLVASNTMNSMYPLSKPFSSITLRSHDIQGFAVPTLGNENERVSDDFEITDLSNSETNSKDEVKSKLSQRSRLAHIMVKNIDDSSLDARDKSETINYNYEVPTMITETQHQNQSPRIIKQKSVTKGAQNQSLQMQYINNLKGSTSSNPSNLSKMIAANTSVATTVLASDNQSMIGQQMSVIPKPIKQQTTAKHSSKSPSIIPGAHNPFDVQSGNNSNTHKAHSPGLRRTDQQTMIQNHTNARKMLQPNKQLSQQPMKQQTALANRVQVSPINKNFALSRDMPEGSSPLISSQSNSNLNKRSGVSQSKVNNSSLVKNLPREGAQSFSQIVHNFTQKHTGRRLAVDLTPPSIGNESGVKSGLNSAANATVQSKATNKVAKREPYSALMRLIAQQRTEEARTFWVTEEHDQMSDEIRNVKLDQTNQNVITADCQRTRFLQPVAKQQMMCVLTYYVNQEEFTYKQGINEICLPFMWLECKRSVIQDSTQGDKREAIQAELPANLGRVFEQLKGFISNFLPNIFINDDFVALQCCMTLIRLLFKYHAPKLYCFLEKHQITVEMYSIPWIITYFSTKMDSPELALELWNKVAQQPPVQDVAYIFFFAVALLVENESLIIESEFASLPVVMASLRIKDQRDIDKVFMRAQVLQENTPYSFIQLPELQLLMNRNTPETLQTIWRQLEMLNTIPILPAELFFYCFPSECECANPNCANSLTYKKSTAGSYLPPESTSICPELDFKLPTIRHALKQTVIGVSPTKSGNHINSPYKKVLINGESGKYAKLPSQMETESNLNYDMDNQESHIDMIHETARMKHLNAVDFRAQNDQFNIRMDQDSLETPEDYENNTFKSMLDDGNINLRGLERAEVGDLCSDCKRRQSIKNKIDSNTNKHSDDSFEDLSSDCLINQIRFIAIDCRLNVMREEGTLPHSLSFELTCSSKLEQLKKQVESLSMYKDTHHICLIGLSSAVPSPEDIQSTPKRKTLKRRLTTKMNKRLTLSDFHEEVSSIIVQLFAQQGFPHVSSLPGGFQQVHDLCQRYEIGLMDHGEQGKRCWHCKQAKAIEQMRVDTQDAIVVKNQGSPRINFQKVQLARVQNEDVEEDALYYLGDCNTPTLFTQHSQSSLSDDDEETKDGRGQELNAKGWDYIPFGLRQVYEAASHINKILQTKRPENRASDPVQPTQGQLQVNATEKPAVQCLTPGKQQLNPKVFSAISQDNQPNHYYNRPLRLSDDVQERNSLSNKKIAGVARENSFQRATDYGRINLKSEYNVGDRGKDKLLSDLRNPQYQNQQHLQQQSQVKLISKVSGTIDNKQVRDTPTIFTVNTAYSPQTKNRPRAGEVQPQDISKYRLMLQEQQRNAQPGMKSQNSQLSRQFSDVTEKGITNLNISNVYNYLPSERSNFTSHGASSVTEYSQSKSAVSQNPSSTNVTNQNDRNETASQFEDSDHPVLNQLLAPALNPEEESYLLNGIVRQVSLSKETYNTLTSATSDSQVSYVFTAVRLPARKKNFQIRNQNLFNFMVPSKILITPFTVAILHRQQDIEDALGTTNRSQYTEEVNSKDFEELAQKQKRKEKGLEFVDHPKLQPQDSSREERDSFAILQSRFYMYDLIKITSRKSTTKIITFYFRIPKMVDYPAAELEKPDILQRLNSKPVTNYAFAFKRKDYEDVSMSFEFELEEQAKMCIVNVSNLYKKLKNTQKHPSKKNDPKIVTEESEMLKQLQVRPFNTVESVQTQKQEPPNIIQKSAQIDRQSNKNPVTSFQRNPQNPSQILSRLTTQQNTSTKQSNSQSTGNHITPSQNSLHQKP